MSESELDLLQRLGRLLEEELSARDIGFALITTTPIDSMRSAIGIQANISVEDVVALLERHAKTLRAKFIDGDNDNDDHAPGHA